MLTWIALSAHFSIDVIWAYAARLFSVLLYNRMVACIAEKNALTFIIDEFCLALVEWL